MEEFVKGEKFDNFLNVDLLLQKMRVNVLVTSYKFFQVKDI